MKLLLCGALLLLSLVLALALEEEREFVPESEYEGIDPVTGKRVKRSAALAFLGGVAAGGIFGPILYNRLYGWGRNTRRPRITFYRGWRPANSGWQEEESSGWQPVSQGWQPQASKGWQPAATKGWESGNQW